VIQQTADEQLLLNIVRLRYSDTPVFLELGSIVAGYSLETRGDASTQLGISGAFAGADPEASFAGVSGGVTYIERPTVTYTPLQGEEFAKRLLTPVPPQILFALGASGWSIERLLLIGAASLGTMENAPTASGPTPKEAPTFENFKESAAAMRRLTKKGVVRIRLLMEDDGVDTVLSVRDPDPADSESIEDLAKLRGWLSPATDVRELSLVKVEGVRAETKLLMHTRSLLGMMYFLSQSVEVPAEHLERGVVTQTLDENGAPFDWSLVTGKVMSIRSSAERPRGAFVATRYRGTWFFIDDADVNSKVSFGLMQHLFSLQASSGKGGSPMLTIPAGG